MKEKNLEWCLAHNLNSSGCHFYCTVTHSCRRVFFWPHEDGKIGKLPLKDFLFLPKYAFQKLVFLDLQVHQVCVYKDHVFTHTHTHTMSKMWWEKESCMWRFAWLFSNTHSSPPTVGRVYFLALISNLAMWHILVSGMLEDGIQLWPEMCLCSFTWLLVPVTTMRRACPMRVKGTWSRPECYLWLSAEPGLPMAWIRVAPTDLRKPQAWECMLMDGSHLLYGWLVMQCYWGNSWLIHGAWIFLI